MKKLMIIGASGFIGNGLKENLKNYEISTYRGRSVTDKSIKELVNDFEGQDILINLAGKTIFTVWTRSNKKEIYNSRMDTVEKIVKALRTMKNPPGHFINASAIGVYESETEVDENSEKFDGTFLARTVIDWEKSLEPLKDSDIKLSVTRFGIVLGKNGGAYKVLRTLTRFNIGGYFNKGEQSLSFIWINDLVNAVDFIIRNKIEGVINIVAPKNTDYRQLLKLMKKELNSFIVWKIPGFIMKLIAGEASQLVLRGHKVKPAVLIKNNFNFDAPDIETCIQKLENN